MEKMKVIELTLPVIDSACVDFEISWLTLPALTLKITG